MSTDSILSCATSLSLCPSAVFGLCTPGVSTSTNCTSFREMIPRIAVLVVFGCREVIATFDPTKELTRVDFPTLGRPTIAINADLCTIKRERTRKRVH